MLRATLQHSKFKLNYFYSVQIRTKTWVRDSHGLFDYENNQVKTTTIVMNSNGSLIRRKNDVIYTDSEKKIIPYEQSEEVTIELGKLGLLNSKNTFYNILRSI